MSTEQAGAALDALVDERIFGNRCTCSYGIQCADIPSYSTDIAAAWLVAERLRELGLHVLISDEGEEWEVEIEVTEGLYQRGYRGCYRQGRAAAEAICRAALHTLAAIGGPVAEREG